MQIKKKLLLICIFSLLLVLNIQKNNSLHAETLTDLIGSWDEVEHETDVYKLTTNEIDVSNELNVQFVLYRGAFIELINETGSGAYNNFLIIYNENNITIEIMSVGYGWNDIDLPNDADHMKITLYSSEQVSGFIYSYSAVFASNFIVNDMTTNFTDNYAIGYNDGLNDAQLSYDRGFSDGLDKFNEQMDEIKALEYERGYTTGETNGYNLGVSENTGSLDWVKALLGLFPIIFDIKILPGLSIGLLIGIVVVIPLATKLLGRL